MAITQDAVHSVHERRPPSALAHHVTCVWIQTVSAHSTAFTHRKAPNGSVELVCAIGSMPRILGPQEAAAHLERTVAERLADAAAPDALVADGVRRLMSGRRADVASMASSLFISERQLRRRFEAATGLAPTTLHRILASSGSSLWHGPASGRACRLPDSPSKPDTPITRT
jgi:AraC-like DNA-binding protein